MKIDLLACPENCDDCQSADKCDQCNSDYAHWDQTQQKCRGEISILYSNLKIFLDCSDFSNCNSCDDGTKGFGCSQCDPGYYLDSLQCHCKNQMIMKIYLLACPENCDDCKNPNKCNQCNSDYPHWDQTQQKCRGKISIIHFNPKIFLDCSDFSNCISCSDGANGFGCSQCQDGYTLSNQNECHLNSNDPNLASESCKLIL